MNKKKKVSIDVYNDLLKKLILDNSTSTICQECVNRASIVTNETNDTELEGEQSNSDSDDSLLIFEQGSKKNIGGIKDLIEHNVTKWLSERPPELINLVFNICDIDINEANDKKVNIIEKIV